MDLLIRLQVYILAFLMLLVLSVQLIATGEDRFLPQRLLRAMILSTMFCICMEALSWTFDGQPGQVARLLAYLANALLLAVNGLPLVAWTLYLDFRVFANRNRVRRIAVPLAILATVHALLAVTAPFNSLYFYLDASNYYHRGVLSPIAISIFIAFLVYNSLLLIRNWLVLERRARLPLLLSLVPPLVGFALQAVSYGTSLVTIGVSVSILIIFTATQNWAITTDYLTGVNNRRQLDRYLEDAIRSPQRRQRLAGIMIDMDDFKRINDNYGHSAGDAAIQTVALTLERCFQGGFVARYAGDEFVVLLEVSEAEQLHQLVDGFRRQLADNCERQQPLFAVPVSIGAAVYLPDCGQNSDQWLAHLDRLMYEQKSARKRPQGNAQQDPSPDRRG